MASLKNIVLIIADQVSWNALPYYGNTEVDLPNISQISNGGTGFDTAFCTYPLCQPSRASFWTGEYPHVTNVLSNHENNQKNQIPTSITTLGTLFKEGGYRPFHFGKTHDGGSLRGFYVEPEGEIFLANTDLSLPLNKDSYKDAYTTKKVVEFLNKDKEDTPFLLAVDYVNPHNICGWIGEFRGKHQDVDPGTDLPSLPDNFDFEDIINRPIPVQYICCTNNRQGQTGGWEKESFRYYLAAYYKYLKMVDKEIGEVLDALKKREDYEDTLIVFMSDHGGSMAYHGRVNKQIDFYEESIRVPMIFKGPKIISRQKPIKNYLASLLDLVPTLCSYAGIPYPKNLPGKNLMPLLKGEKVISPLYVSSEWYTEWGYTISPGRMIRTSRYKYTVYLEGRGEELFDLVKDPLEMTNLISNPDYQKVLQMMRSLFKKHEKETADNFNELEVKVDLKWRKHEVGYLKHRGLAAPEYYDKQKKEQLK